MVDCHGAETKQTHCSLALRRYIDGAVMGGKIMSRILLSSVAAVMA